MPCSILTCQIARGASGATAAAMMGGGRTKTGRRKSQGGGSSGGSGNIRSTPVTVNGPLGQQASCSGDSPGESEEYDDSCGSESDDCTRPHHHHHRHRHQQQQQQHLVMNMLGSENTMNSKACRYSAVPGGQGGAIYGQGGGRPIFLNDETLLVSDKKSLPRGLRSK